MSIHRSHLLALNDPVLARYLATNDEVCRGREMEKILLEEVQPRARRVLAEYIRNDWPIGQHDVDDIVAQVTLALIRKLRAATVLEDESVQSVEAYVITLTRNLLRDYMRRRTPERTRLKSRLRYLFTHDSRFALWTAGTMVLCGLAKWRDRADRESDVAAIRSAAAGPLTSASTAAETLAGAFRQLGRPVRLGDLVSATVTEESPDRLPGEAEEARGTHGDAVEARQYLEVLWRELRELPPRQQAALLLNLREPGHGNALLLFLTVRLATFEEVAAAVAMTPAQLVAIWDELPLEDLRIARHLDLTRQQVINLRKAARQRLARRMAGRGGGGKP